jgi:hypothetical protein
MLVHVVTEGFAEESLLGYIGRIADVPTLEAALREALD